MKFEIGDKVRTVVGEVIDVTGECKILAQVQHADGVRIFRTDVLEFVERPKPEPKVGSRWEHRILGEGYLYLGDKFYINIATHSIVEQGRDRDLSYYLEEVK